jgi:hypothetical protein
VRRLLVVIGAAALTIGGGAPAAAQGDDRSTALSVSIDDGATTVRRGATPTYEVIVRNHDSERAATPLLKVDPPNGTTFTHLDDAATDWGVLATWPLAIAPGASKSITAHLRVEELPKGQGGLAATACVFASGDDRVPIVCATDIDQIEGARDIGVVSKASSRAAKASERDSFADLPRWLWWTGFVATIIAAGAVILFWRRRVQSRVDQSA